MVGFTDVEPPEFVHLPLRLLSRLGIVDDVATAGTFLIERKLRRFAGQEVALAPAAGKAAGQPDFARRGDEDDQVAELVPAGLEQEGGVENDGGRALASRG